MTSSRVLVSGASGPIGAALLPSLKARGCAVTRLVRVAATGADQITWNPAHLVARFCFGLRCGHSPGGRIDRRPLDEAKSDASSTAHTGHGHLAEALAKRPRPAGVHLGFRGGYYGNRGDGILENRVLGGGFLRGVPPVGGCRRPARRLEFALYKCALEW